MAPRPTSRNWAAWVRHVCKWCFVPDGDLVAGDVMLAQKIALETNERSALSVAHRSFVAQGPRRF